jgi:hypothetical protein
VLAAAGVIHIGWTAGFALAVMALGAGMMIGGLVGRARRLIPVALVLAVPMIAASALNVPLHGQTGKVAWSASSARAVASPYEMATGVGTLDLSTLDPMGGTVQVVAHVGGGKLVVTVPADVAVRVTAHVGFGRIDVPDRETISGIDLTKTYDIQVAGASKGTIVLDLRVGAGDLEVQHG